MPVTFDVLVTRVCETLQSEQYEVDRDKVARVVRATLAGIDHHVNTETGEVYSPIPPPVNIFPPRERMQTGVHYRGQVRRSKKGYRR